MCCGLDEQGIMVKFPKGEVVFLFLNMSRRALGPTQPAAEWALGALFPGLKC